MSRTTLRKESSYSQFRKKNSLSKNNLHKSMLQMDNSISLIADEKTQELLSMQNQLQSLVRNRSLSAKPSAKCVTQETVKFNFQKKTQTTDDDTLHIVKRNSIHAMTTIQNIQKTSRSIQFQPFNQTFQIIQQSEVHNQEDNGLYDTKQQTNKITSSKAVLKNEKNTINKRKNSNHIMQSIKPQSKATIKDLDDMQKRLESAKKKTKIDLKDKEKRVIKKAQLINKPAPQKTERKLYRTASQAVILTDNAKLRGLQILKQKDLTPKPVIRKKFPLAESVKCLMPAQKEGSNQLIPTKLVNSEQKQKLLKQFDRIKDSVKNTDICADNMDAIRNMLKAIQGLIN